ncbi:hypothetical protein NLJ89_g10352 [Agrocybe chaxingu]|uniref:Uncharacterized protein n=1 Tax=Agrocybe chaxingu TaxID=84603 RepID=A0A9W8JUD2_9AGAR|nr:hypothetical protein NLJ89_g10352 [Agrocybe chaxingu]
MSTSIHPPLPAPNVFAIPEVAAYNRLAVANADPANWQWSDGSRAVWELAQQDLQEFAARWYGATAAQCATLVDPEFPSLPLPTPFNSSLSSILVRKSYVEIFNQVWARALSSQGLTGVLITGQPGIGKTLFQYYLLVRLLQQKQLVLFSLDGEWLYLFYHHGVYTVTMPTLAAVQPGLQLPEPTSMSSNVFIWSLFDIQKREEPDLLFVTQPCLPVQTASPDPCRYKIWDKERSPLLAGLPLWSRDELAQGLRYQKRYQSLLDTLHEVHEGSSQHHQVLLEVFLGLRELLEEYQEDGASLSPEDALNHILEAAIERFGYSARDVFSAVFNYNRTTEFHKQAFNISYDKLQAAICALWKRGPDDSILDCVLTLSPDYGGYLRNVRWTVDFKSDWVARSVIEKLGTSEETVICQQARFLQRLWGPKAAGMAGRFFGPLIHRCIMETSEGGTWPLINMISDGADPPQFVAAPGAASHIPNDVQFAGVKREVFEFQSTADLPAHLENNVYYMAKDPAFPLFDAFTVDLDYWKKSAVLWILLMTTSRLQGGSSLGYQKICEIIANLKDQLQEGPPSGKCMKITNGQIASTPRVEVRYLLVVPKGGSENLRWQFPRGWSKNLERNDHRGDVYCLEVPLTVMSSEDADRW